MECRGPRNQHVDRLPEDSRSEPWRGTLTVSGIRLEKRVKRAIRTTRRSTVWAVILMGVAATQVNSDPMEATTLRRLTWAADPRISPNGAHIAFVRITVDRDRDDYQGNLWIVRTADGDARPLTFSGRDGHPRWSPDGRFIAFLREVENEPRGTVTQPARPPKTRSHIFLLPMNGGEARRLTSLKAGAGPFIWSPDGARIVFASSQEPPVTPDNLASLLPATDQRAVVVTRPVFRREGQPGLIDPEKRSHLWSISIDDGEPIQFTSGVFDERSPVFSPNGKTLYFVSDRRTEPWFGRQDADIFAMPAAGGAMTRVCDVRGPLASPVVSGDGTTIAALGYDTPAGRVRSYNQTDLLVMKNNDVANVTSDYDFTLGNSIGADAVAPIARGSEHLRFVRDGDAIITRISRQGRCPLVEIDLQKRSVKDLVTGDLDVVSWSATHDGRRFALLIASPTSAGDLYVYDYGSTPRSILPIGSDSLADVDRSEPEEFWYESFDGLEIQGWVMKPHAFDPTTKHPMILQIHGGPHMAYGYGFYQEFQLLAARGFVVLYLNPRGSTSYGQTFGNLVQHAYPGDDFKDLLAGVDHIVEQGFVDDARIGITGGSGGGLLTNWAITQTNRFAAAVTQRCVSDWSSFYYTTDFTLFTPTWFRSAPFLDPNEYASRSPLTYVERIDTPLMIIHSENDYRTPISQGEAMFRALIALRKPVTMVRFPGESHGLSRAGTPSLRIERLDHIVSWFEMFLMGRVTDRYGDELQSLARQRQGSAQSATIP